MALSLDSLPKHKMLLHPYTSIAFLSLLLDEKKSKATEIAS